MTNDYLQIMDYSQKCILINIGFFAFISLIQIRSCSKQTPFRIENQETFKQQLNKMVTVSILIRLLLLIGIYIIEKGDEWTDTSSSIYLLRFIFLSFPQMLWILNCLILIRFYYKIYYNVGLKNLFDIQNIFKLCLSLYFIAILFAELHSSKQKLVQSINLLITVIYCVLSVSIVYLSKKLISQIQSINDGDKKQLNFLVQKIKYISYIWTFGLVITIIYIQIKYYHFIYKFQSIFDQLIITMTEFLSSLIFINTTYSKQNKIQEPHLIGYSNEIEMQQVNLLNQKLISQNNF